MDIAVIETNRARAWQAAFASFVIGLLIWWTFSEISGSQAFRGVLGFLVMVFGTAFFAAEALHPRRLRIQQDALVMEREGKAPTVLAWNDIESFKLIRRRYTRLVGYRLRKGAEKPQFAWLNRMFEGVDGIFYGFWAEKPDLMTAKLGLFLETLRDPPPAPIPADQTVSLASPRLQPQPPPQPRPRPLPQPASAAAPPAIVSEPRRWFGPRRDRDQGPGDPIVR